MTKQERDERIIIEIHNGASYADISERYNLKVPTIRCIWTHRGPVLKNLDDRKWQQLLAKPWNGSADIRECYR
jgi:hypothetical protein